MRTKLYPFNYQQDHKFVSLTQQNLLQQAIDVKGLDTHYLPKSQYIDEDYDTVFREMSEKNYNEIYTYRSGLIDESFFEEGTNDLFSQFGLTVEDQINIIFTQYEFWSVKQDEEYDFSKGISSYVDIDFAEEKPEIDDLIYVDQWGGKLFKILTVEDPYLKSSRFNQGVAWNVTLQLWKASSKDTIDVDGNDFPDTEEEFINIINTIDDNASSIDLEESDLEKSVEYPQPEDTDYDTDFDDFMDDTDGSQTGETYDVGNGDPFDVSNDNYEREAHNTVKDNDEFDPFNQW